MDEKIMKNEWEISRTIDNLTWELDNKNLQEAMKVFTEDVHFSIIEDGKTVLSTENKTALQDALALRSEPYDIIFHNNGTKMIDVKVLEQTAVSNTTSVARLIRREPAACTTQYMEYADKLIKVSGCWYIVERTVQILSRSEA